MMADKCEIDESICYRSLRLHILHGSICATFLHSAERAGKNAGVSLTCLRF